MQTMRNDRKIFENIYEAPNAGWTSETPPEQLVELIENKTILPCKAIDIGCGEGFNSIYLASKGFDVYGIDISQKAIDYAQENAMKSNSTVGFMRMDVNSLLVLVEMEEVFDFALEWSLLHHIEPDQRSAYIGDLGRIINKGGKYLATCFSTECNTVAESDEKTITSPIGTKLHYSTQEELVELYEAEFTILEKKLFTFEAPEGVTHTYNYFFMEKK